MRILHCLDSIDPALAGPVEAARQFTMASRRRGHEIEIVCLDDNAGGWAQRWPAPVHALGGYSSYRYSPRLAPWYRDHAARFDVAIVHGVFKYHLVGTWRGLRNGPIPYLVILHGMLNPWFQATYPRKHLKKLLFWHTLIHPGIRGAAALIYLCAEEKRLALSSFRIEPREEEFLPLGIEGAPARRDLTQPAAEPRRVILFLGRICVMKGCDVLVRAFAAVCGADPSLTLMIAGPDSEQLQAGLAQVARSLGIGDRVSWPGPLYDLAKWDAFRSAEAFILPSHCETFPVAVLEALSASVPVLISRQVNIYPHVMEHGAGLVFEDTEDGTRQALAKWLGLPAAERLGMRRRARQCFESEFEINSALAKHLDAYAKYARPFCMAAG